MEIGKLTTRYMSSEDICFFQELVDESPQWKKEELGDDVKISSITEKYSHLQGKWRVWLVDDNKSAISFHVERSPSNGKPWIGTIVVSSSSRKKGLAREIIENLCQELKENENKVLFAGVPLDQNDWIDFLSRCNFEQLKVENEELKSYMIMIRPL